MASNSPFHQRLARYRETQEFRPNEAEIAAANARIRHAGLVRRAEEVGLPRHAGLRTVALTDNPPPTMAIAAVQEALQWHRKQKTTAGSLDAFRSIGGPPGVGKSVSIGWALIHCGGSARWTTANAICGTPRNGWSENEVFWQDILTVQTLGIDDLGREVIQTPAVITYLLTERANSGLLTLASTNFSAADVITRYFDGALSDRILNGQKSHGLDWYVLATGKSLREKAVQDAIGKESKE
jgi:hypothetical protein